MIKVNALCLKIAAATLTPLMIVSCEKIDHPVEKQAHVIIDTTTIGSPVIIDNIIAKTYPPDWTPEQENFDWENSEYLPLPPDAEAIPMPWNPIARTSFSDDIKYDYKKADGWELYLSTFSTKMNTAVKAFFLYNKYRGVLRYYYYLEISPSDAEKFRDYNILSQSISSAGSHSSESPLLNFAHQNIIDLNNNSTATRTLEAQAMAPSIWYAWEYELAFDKEIYDQDHNSFGLVLGFGMIKREHLAINGKQLNNLSGKIRFSGANVGFNEYYNGDISLVLYGKDDLSQMIDVLSPSDIAILNEIFYQQSFDDMLSGNMNYNSLGEILWDAEIEISTQPNGVGLPGGNHSTTISGTDNSSIQGLAPFYTHALGVFYLNVKPKVNYTEYSAESFQYSLDVSSVQYIFNPSVLEIANIENIQQELIATQDTELFDLNGRKELFIGQKLTSDMPLNIQGVRVSFDVVPKDGNKPVHIVKMFAADIVRSQ